MVIIQVVVFEKIRLEVDNVLERFKKREFSLLTDANDIYLVYEYLMEIRPMIIEAIAITFGCDEVHNLEEFFSNTIGLVNNKLLYFNGIDEILEKYSNGNKLLVKKIADMDLDQNNKAYQLVKKIDN